MRIAIIGAGFTGSYLAAELIKAGHNVEVFDKARGRGGRCTTKRLDWGKFDLGAPVMPVTSDGFSEFLQSLGREHVASRWDPRVFDFEESLRTSQRQLDYWVFTPGMSSACHHFLNDVPLHTQCLVSHLQKLRQGWMIWCADERRFGTYDKVILTLPYPQAVSLLEEHQGGTSQSNVPWSPCWTVALSYPFAPVSVPDLVYSRSRDIQTLVHDSAKPGRTGPDSVWVAHLSHPASERMLDCSKEEVREHVIDQLNDMFDGAFSSPQHHYEHRWRFARPERGTLAPGQKGSPADGLYATGDWSEGASVEAAWMASRDLLRSLLQ